MQTLFSIAILAPALAAVVVLFLRRGAATTCIAATSISLIGSFAAWVHRDANVVWPRALSNSDYSLRLQLSGDAAVQSLVVAAVGLLIFVYARRYMEGKGRPGWFWSAMSLFLAAMQLLVFADNWFTVITGWELMGMTSYFLIAFHHELPEARSAATKAFLLTRVTDLGLYIGAFAYFHRFHTLGFSPLNDSSDPLPEYASLCLLLAAMGKAALLPFQSWLKGAMLGPTPVSALLHSATMVSAGALLLIKMYPILGDATLVAVACIGGATAVLAGVSALVETDLKRLLANSTSSQLGFMVLAVGAGAPGAAFAHWIAHAFMKSGLFLSVGALQERYGSTAIERLTGVGRKNLSVAIGGAACALALAGIPPLIGYHSKDAVLAAAEHSPLAWLYFPLACAGALATAAYVGRALSALFKRPNAPQAEPRRGESPMLIGIWGLAGAVVLGSLFLKEAVGAGGFQMPSSLLSTLLGLGIAIVGIAAGWLAKTRWLASPRFAYARSSYKTAGGFAELVADPTIKTAAFFRALDDRIAAAPASIARGAEALARSMRWSDERLESVARLFGEGTARFAHHEERRSERSLTQAVLWIAERVNALGELGRRLQSGMTHKELMLSTAGFAVGLLTLLATLYLT